MAVNETKYRATTYLGMDLSQRPHVLVHVSLQTDTVDSVALAKAAANEAAVAVQQAVLSQTHTAAQLQAKEADVQALAELTRVLDKKVSVLRRSSPAR